MPNPPSADDAPLAGIRVVELSMYVQGPVAGLTLGSLGADVVKIEQVGHADIMRSFTTIFGVDLDERGQEWMYASLNRNKRSLALDITSENGRRAFHRLIAEADVFVSNLRQDGLEKMGADPDTLLAANPRLVYARGAGLGTRGPLADDPCQDTVGMAYAGFMDVTSTGDAPNYPPGSMSDVLTGTNMAAAVLAGLVKRSTTGKGCVVATSQVQSLLWMELQGIGITANLGERMARFDPDNPPQPLFNTYQTADGWIAIAALRTSHWRLLAETLDLGHLIDSGYPTMREVIARRRELQPLLAQRFATETTTEWWSRLRAAGVWVSPVNRLDDLPQDEHILANDYLVTFPDGFVGPPAPFEVDNWLGARGGTADYGEHTDDVLAELGYGDDEILALRIDGSIW